MADALVEIGLHIEVARDGFEAGAMLCRLKPAVMVLDLGLPGISGTEVIRRTTAACSGCAQRQFCSTRILVVTGHGDDEISEVMAAGAADALRKPFEREELVSKVVRLLRLVGQEGVAPLRGEPLRVKGEIS
jgi:DNA-binding response OmpR family regulator